MTESIFVDTSAWYAYVNKRDPKHHRIASLLEAEKRALVTSNYIFDEIITLSRMRLGHTVALAIGQVLLNPRVVYMERVNPRDEKHAWQLFSARKDQSYSFTDCTSFILMKRMKIQQAVTLDDHFLTEGFSVLR